MADETDGLQEFTISIDWHTPRPTEVETVIARSREDAEEIAVRIFWRTHTLECVIDAVSTAETGAARRG